MCDGNPLTRKLRLFGELPSDDECLLDDIVRSPREVAADQNLISEGDNPDAVRLIMKGLACRYKITENGRRQITAFLLPGDFCDLHIFILTEMDHSISTLSPSIVVDIPRERILELMRRPALARALWWATLVDEATLREALVNIGQREAEKRIAHLFCELHLRLQVVGLADGDTIDLPLTQAELADATGISVVHANRSLQALRSQQLIRVSQRNMTILDLERLRQLSGFDPKYLHLRGGKRDRVPA